MGIEEWPNLHLKGKPLHPFKGPLCLEPPYEKEIDFVEKNSCDDL